MAKKTKKKERNRDKHITPSTHYLFNKMKFYHILYSKVQPSSQTLSESKQFHITRNPHTTINLLLRGFQQQKVFVRKGVQSQQNSTNTTKQGDVQCWPFGMACWNRRVPAPHQMLPLSGRSLPSPAWWWRVVEVEQLFVFEVPHGPTWRQLLKTTSCLLFSDLFAFTLISVTICSLIFFICPH